MSHSRGARLLLVMLLLGAILPGVGTSPASARSKMVPDLQLSQLVSLAAGRSGTVYVLDWTAPHIDRISSDGVLLATWPVRPALPGASGRVAVDGKDDVYVVRNVQQGKSLMGAITKYSPRGQVLVTWSNVVWRYPIALAARSDGTLYVLVGSLIGNKPSAMVSTVSPGGKIVGAWHLDTYDRDSLTAQAIATDIHGTVYVSGAFVICQRYSCQADSYFRIRLAPSGPKPLRTWIDYVPTGPGLAADGDGSIYTAGNDVVTKFGTTKKTGSWSEGKAGCGPLAFNTLADLGIDGHVNLYVLDSGNRVIQKISTSGTWEASWGACPATPVPPTVVSSTPIPPTPIRPTATATRPAQKGMR